MALRVYTVDIINPMVCFILLGVWVVSGINRAYFGQV